MLKVHADGDMSEIFYAAQIKSLLNFANCAFTRKFLFEKIVFMQLKFAISFTFSENRQVSVLLCKSRDIESPRKSVTVTLTKNSRLSVDDNR